MAPSPYAVASSLPGTPGVAPSPYPGAPLTASSPFIPSTPADLPMTPADGAGGHGEWGPRRTVAQWRTEQPALALCQCVMLRCEGVHPLVLYILCLNAPALHLHAYLPSTCFAAAVRACPTGDSAPSFLPGILVNVPRPGRPSETVVVVVREILPVSSAVTSQLVPVAGWHLHSTAPSVISSSQHVSVTVPSRFVAGKPCTVHL